MINLTDERVDQVGSLCVGDKKYPIFEGINTIGRDPGCDILLSDITVSKNHAEIKARPKSAFVCDLRSSNKTRLNNEILRPLRFYQVVDEAEITFGTVNARYLFLRDIDNEIIVPETPASSAKTRLNLVIANKKNLNYSTISESDEDDDSVIPSTQTNDDDDRLFAIPSPRNRRSSTKIVNCNVQIQKTTKKIISIHDVETQQLNDESSKDISNSETHYNNDADDLEDIYTMQTQKITPPKSSQRSIHDIETQKLGETEEIEINMGRNKVANPFVNLKRSIHELETQKLDETKETEFIVKKRKVINPFMKLEQSIHELETQKLNTNEEVQSNAAKAALCNAIILDDIFTAETQRNVEAKDESSSIKVQKNQFKNIEDVAAAKESKEINKKVESNKKNENSKASEAISETSQNKTSNLIIDETDDDASETDEEGAFANVQIRVEHCDQPKKKNVNRIPDSDSETDEDGEFAALGPDWSKGSANSSKKIVDDKNDNTVTKRQIETRSDPESPCLNERFAGQNSILNDEIMNSDDDESADNINNSEKNHQADLLNKNGDGNYPLLPTTPKLSSAECKSNKSARKSLNKTFISDDDDDVNTASTQFIPIPESNKSIKQSPKAKTEFEDDDDDDLVPTQIVQSPKKQVTVEQIEKTNVKSDNIHDMKSSQISISNDKIEAKKFSKKNQKDDAHENDKITVRENISNTQSKNNVVIDDSSNNSSANLNNNHSLSSTSSKLSRNISNKITARDYHCYNNDMLTQVLDVQTANTYAQIGFEKAVIDKNHDANDQLSDKNKSNNNAETPSRKLRKIINNEVEKSKMSLRKRRNLDTSIAAIEEQPNNPGDLNDSISENLENLFGKENKVDNIIQPITLATQQLQDILEHSDNISYKKCNKVQAADKLNVLNSPDNDSEEYFNNLHSKRKHCMIIESDDTTELEEDTSTSSTAKNIVYEAGTSGFEKGVAVISETTIGVCASPVKKQPKNSIKKDSVAELKSTNKTTLSDEEEEEDDEKDDILKGLPEVRIYGTASYPASPTTSVCSLDEWEKYERKRIESLEAKKVKRRLNTADSTVANVSSDTKIQVPINEKKLPIQLKEKKSSVSSDDEDLNYEDLKKMAVDFIAADTRTKELSIKLEKISDPQNYRSFSNDVSKEYSSNPDEKLQVLPDKRKRGRPKKVNDSESVLENNKDNLEDIIKSVDNISQIKRSRLQDTSVDSSSCSSTTGSESLEVKTDLEVRKRVRKIPEKFKDSNVLPNIQQTPSRSKKSKANIIESPSSSSNRIRPQHIVLLTGVNRTEYERKVKQCGGIISDMPDEATILVTDKIRRTNKLFCAITRHIPIVSVEWIEDSMKEKSFLDWNDYFLKDPAVEAKYKFSLKESLERAANKKLLDGFTFLITSHVIQPSVEEIKSMIQMSGGKALVRPPKVWTPNTIIITCLDDVKKVKSLLSKVPIDLKIPVFSTEFILSGILKQELNFDANCIQV